MSECRCFCWSSPKQKWSSATTWRTAWQWLERHICEALGGFEKNLGSAELIDSIDLKRPCPHVWEIRKSDFFQPTTNLLDNCLGTVFMFFFKISKQVHVRIMSDSQKIMLNRFCHHPPPHRRKKTPHLPSRHLGGKHHQVSPLPRGKRSGSCYCGAADS